jgi:hypothetical protein
VIAPTCAHRWCRSWVQQEAPKAVNEALLAFLSTLSC